MGRQCFHQKTWLLNEVFSARCGIFPTSHWSVLVVVVVKYHDERQLKEEFILASSSGGLLSMMAGKVWRQQKVERS